MSRQTCYQMTDLALEAPFESDSKNSQAMILGAALQIPRGCLNLDGILESNG